MSFLGWALRSEYDVEDKIRRVLEKFVGQKFNGVTITLVRPNYEVEGRRAGIATRWADIAVLKDDGNPLLIIETKKKKERGGSWSVERRFIPTSEDVVGQAASYAALLKRNKGVYVPFIATANETQLALFKVPEDIENLVNWDAIRERDYERVIKDFYEFKKKNIILHKPHGPFSEEFFKELLDTITGIYVKKYSFEEKRQELHWQVLGDLRSFVDFLTPFIEQAIAEKGRFKDSIASMLEEYRKKTGYNPTPQQLAREMAYVLLNKILFYKVLEHYYNLPRLGPLYKEGDVKTCSEYLKRLREYFVKAVEVTRDFQPVFETGIYDEVDLVENEGVLKAIDWLINLVEKYKIERLGDVIGFIYEDLIPGEERHQLGQFYTPKPIAELIVKWSVRSPDDKVLDPGCGSGTFLVEAYRRLAELKLKKPWSEIKYVDRDVHEQILRQLYGVDINEFPAHLTAMNLAMKNVRAPSREMYVFVRDYFTIMPGQQVLTPSEVKTVEGEKPVEVVFKDFDAVVGNPPYTRWKEIPESTRKQISDKLGNIMSKYDLEPNKYRRAEPGIYVYWIIHSTRFLKEGGRLGMIISDSWLQTDYGRNFFNFLLDHYKIHAVIDISTRVFPAPLIGASIVLLEKCSNENERKSNKTLFMYLDVSKGSVNIDEILKFIDEAKSEMLPGQAISKVLPSGATVLVRAYIQGELAGREERVINFLFNTDDILNSLRQSPLIVKLSELFEPSRGNTVWSVWATKHGIGPDVGGEKFFYLDENRVRQLGIPKECLYPLLPSPDYLKFFTFVQQDWEEVRREGDKCYLFLCRRPRNELPPQVLRYVRLGEGPDAEIRLRRRRGEPEGRPVNESQASQTRLRYRNIFIDWYDLGGVVEAPIYVARGTQYWIRFTLAKFQSALDDRVLALIPRQGVQFDEVELKALLAYLNSSFTQIQAEAKSRSTPGGMIELDIKPLSSFLVLDVKKLSRENVEKLAQLFDRLEAEARRLGGANAAESVFGSELAKELPSKSNVNVKPGVEGLFNTVIREIDYEVARVLGLENLVEQVRAMVLEMARRRLSRASEAKPEAVKGTEEVLELRESERRRGKRRGEAGGKGVMQRRLDEFM
ncbi:MAG: N-6 DNA methylase [Sulfolobales archaeon]|nr:N-6 DNA methylase [Sulfolobales archaeon]